MHILILNWRDPKNPLSGGAEIVTQKHAEAWVKAGHQVTWFTSCFKGARKHEELNGVHVVRCGSDHTVHLAALFYYLFSKTRFDMVIDEIHGLPFFTPLYVREPKIAFIHEIAGKIWDYMSVPPLNKIGKIIENLYFYLYRSVPFWTDAPSTVDELISHGIDRSKCFAIPCPPANKPLDRLPRKEQKLTFIFVSRLVKMKGVEDVIRTFSLITKPAQLWIVGVGDSGYVQDLHLLIKKLGLKQNSVRFYGKVSVTQKLQLMRRAHLLLHASVKEGWGLVVVEAASQATPAIVYNVAGLRDSVKNWVTGIVLSENTPTEMARQAMHLLEDKKRYELYQKNCLTWAKSLSWSKVTAQSLHLLKSIVQ